MLSPREVCKPCGGGLFGHHREALSTGPGPTAVLSMSAFPLHPHLSQQESLCKVRLCFMSHLILDPSGVLVKKTGLESEGLGLNPCSASK